MKLSNCEIRPGVVVTADDPKKMGRIKAVVPGWFNNASMHEEDMFWIAPFTSGSGYQRVSKCIEALLNQPGTTAFIRPIFFGSSAVTTTPGLISQLLSFI